MKEESFNDEEIKRIVLSIIIREFKDNNLDYSVSIGTFADLVKAVKNNKRITKKQKKNFIRSIGKEALAFHSVGSKSIIVFSDRIRQQKTLERQLIITIFSCYHEVRHAIQRRFDEYSYEKFLFYIEDYFREKNERHYLDYHNSYSFEIGADLYAINKTTKILKSLYPSVYEKEKDFIDLLEQKIIDDYYLYNAYYFVNYLFESIISTGEVPDNKVLKIFFNEDGSFKKIDEIIHNENYEKLDKRIVYNMLSSPLALTNIDEESNEGILLLKKSNEYSLRLNINQENYLSKKKN